MTISLLWKEIPWNYGQIMLHIPALSSLFSMSVFTLEDTQFKTLINNVQIQDLVVVTRVYLGHLQQHILGLLCIQSIVVQWR